MAVPDPHGLSLREGFTANMYALDAAFRRDDGFTDALAAICSWARTLGDYDSASIDVFTGDGHRTVSGTPQPTPALDVVHRVVSRHPRRRFHSLSPLAAGDDRAALPVAWAGATLVTAHGTALGSVNLWSARPVTHDDAVHERLPLLARATMQILEQRRGILTRRSALASGPRPVVERGPAPPAPGTP